MRLKHLGMAVLFATQTSYAAKAQFDGQATSEVLLRDQMESAFAEPYRAPGEAYTAVEVPEGYTLEVELLQQGGSPNAEIIRITATYLGITTGTLEAVRTLR